MNREDMQKTINSAVLLGGSGLLGHVVKQALQHAGVEKIFAPSHNELDVLDFIALEKYLAAHPADVLFNCVAYTKVDKAEEEEFAAMQLNAELPAALGKIIKDRPFFMIHYSTDFVFDGKKTEPYIISDEVLPLCVYAATKLAGEKALLEMDLPNCAILRTAWLFGPGGKNFVRTILNVCRTKGEARVVDDQTGSPTYTKDLAQYSVAIAKLRQGGLFHVVNSGRASWRDLAVEAVRLAGLDCPVHPISSDDLNLPAKRPAFSVLDTSKFSQTTGITPRSWQEALKDYISVYPEG